MKRTLLTLLLAIFMALALTGSASAQASYSFSLDEETVHVYWNSDGTIAVDYVFSFTNDSGGHVIDFVDVGMPNNNFDWGSITADANGVNLDISSDFQGEGGSGFAVDMGSQAIQPGSSGKLHVQVGRITDMVHPDTSDSNYASGEFSPTWFGSAYVHGDTTVTVYFHFPPGVLENESRYHTPQGGWPCSEIPAATFDDQNRIMYTWQCVANGYTQYTFGLSFPKQYVPVESIVTAPAFDIFGFLAGLAGGAQNFCCFGIFILLFVGSPILSAVSQRKRKLQYLPPKISIEGHGIKRGLTAVEAAVLMEQPLDKVMTMILFGVVKKDAAVVLTRDPLKLQVAETLPDGLHEYEKDFLAAFKDPNKTPKLGLQEMMVNLVKAVSEKMKGFSRKETTEYYKSIMERAWQQIEAAGTPEVKSEMYEQAMEWTMLDRDYDARTRRVFSGPVFIPMWWGRYDPSYRTAGAPISVGRSVGIPSGGRSSVSVPGAAFAASMVNSVQGFSSRVLGDLSSFTSGVTNRTNPPPKPSSSSGYRGGGGGRSCACACACAGCACACAGGGR